MFGVFGLARRLIVGTFGAGRRGWKHNTSLAAEVAHPPSEVHGETQAEPEFKLARPASDGVPKEVIG